MHSTSRWYVMVCVAMLGCAGLRWAGLGWLPAYHHGHLLARLHSEREAFQNAGVLRGRVAKAHVAELNPSLELCRLELLRLFIATRHTHACVSSATSTITTNGRDRRVGGQTGRQAGRWTGGQMAGGQFILCSQGRAQSSTVCPSDHKCARPARRLQSKR